MQTSAAVDVLSIIKIRWCPFYQKNPTNLHLTNSSSCWRLADRQQVATATAPSSLQRDSDRRYAPDVEDGVGERVEGGEHKRVDGVVRQLRAVEIDRVVLSCKRKSARARTSEQFSDDDVAGGIRTNTRNVSKGVGGKRTIC